MIKRIALWLAVCSICLVTFACGSQGTGNSQQVNSQSANAGVPSANKSPQSSVPASSTAPFAEYKVEWVSNKIPSEMKAGETQKVAVTIKNTSSVTWPSASSIGTDDYSVRVSYHWLPAKGDDPLVYDGLRTNLPHDVAPGESVTLDNVNVEAPKQPGSYRLQLARIESQDFQDRGRNL